MWKPETSIIKYFDGNDAVDCIGIEVEVKRPCHILRKFDGVYDSIQGFGLHCLALTLGLVSQYLLAIPSVADNLPKVPYRILR